MFGKRSWPVGLLWYPYSIHYSIVSIYRNSIIPRYNVLLKRALLQTDVSTSTQTIFICNQEWPSEQLKRAYFLAVIVLSCYTVPLFIITVLYTLIGYRVWHRDAPGFANTSDVCITPLCTFTLMGLRCGDGVGVWYYVNYCMITACYLLFLLCDAVL